MAVQTLTSTTPAYQTKKTVQVEPEETQRSVSYQAPTPEMQEYIREHIIKPTAQAYGVNPDTGEVTPFQALGYNPEDERKRREAEMALNDRKRKENAWYNAFAVVGDSLTAALGGNVWQRQPNRIGEKVNADNQRLIAEQKAEDMNNAAMMRNAGVKYADAVNRLIQNYLTKTTTTNKSGGSRTETTDHPQVVSTRQVLDKSKSGNGSGGGSGRGAMKILKVQLKDGSNVDIRMNTGQHKATGRYLSAMYNALLNSGEEKVGSILSNNGIYPKEVVDKEGNKHYEYDAEDIMASGVVFDNPKIRNEFIKAIKNDPTLSTIEKKKIVDNMQRYGQSSSEVFKQFLIKMLFGAANTFNGEQSADQTTTPATIGKGRLTRSQIKNSTDSVRSKSR